MIGVSLTWTVELAYGTPFLLSLNLSRQLTALVWLAGPISGIIVQPLIGAISDNSNFRLGKRRPFIIMGTFIVLVSLVCLAFGEDLATLLIGSDSTLIHYWTVVIVVISFYTLDFSLNMIQAMCRALVVDCFCAEQQDTVNAFCGNMGNITCVFGYLLGYTDLTKHLPSVFGGGGSSQFKALCLINIVVLIFSISVSCICTNEKISVSPTSFVTNSAQDKHCFTIGRYSTRSIINTLKYIWQNIKQLSSPVKRLYLVIFFSWMGWFPFLFYSSTWIAGIYYQEHPDKTQDLVHGNLENGTRAGSFALLMYAIASVISGTILPWMTNRRYVTLKTVYTCSLVLLSVIFFCIYWIRTLQTATVVVGLIGISWSCANWIPYALIAEYIHLDNNNNDDDDEKLDIGNGTTYNDSSVVKLSTTTSIIVDDSDTESSLGSSKTNGLENTGISLGIMNIFASLPQFVVSLFIYVFFAIRQSYLNQPSPSSFGSNDNAVNDVAGVAWLFVFGSFTVLIAAGLSRRLLNV